MLDSATRIGLRSSKGPCEGLCALYVRYDGCASGDSDGQNPMTSARTRPSVPLAAAEAGAPAPPACVPVAALVPPSRLPAPPAPPLPPCAGALCRPSCRAPVASTTAGFSCAFPILSG